MDFLMWKLSCWLNCIDLLSTDTGCHLEEILQAMTERDGYQEKSTESMLSLCFDDDDEADDDDEDNDDDKDLWFSFEIKVPTFKEITYYLWAPRTSNTWYPTNKRKNVGFNWRTHWKEYLIFAIDSIYTEQLKSF